MRIEAGVDSQEMGLPHQRGATELNHEKGGGESHQCEGYHIIIDAQAEYERR